jgi:hypothetical protein
MATVTIPGGSGTVGRGDTLIVDGPVAETDVITFYYEPRDYEFTCTLIINDVTTFKGTVGGFYSDYVIKFGNSGITSVVVDPHPTSPAPDPRSGVIPARIHVFGSNGEIGSFVLSPLASLSVGDGEYEGDTFTLTTEGGFHVLTTSHARCFAAGTMLRTPDGEKAVEDLAIGDLLATALGHGPRPVCWIGRRTVNLARHPRPDDIAPVRIRAGALGPGRPARDVVLSPDHAIHFAGRLIPVRHILNGATILPDEATTLTYYHVELAGPAGTPVHDVVLASGLPVESYLDTDGHAGFANGGVIMALHPDFARDAWTTRACAPLLTEGMHLAAARRHILREAARLGHAASVDPEPRLVAGDRIVLPERRGTRYRFPLPKGRKSIRLLSRRFVPAQMLPDSMDWRELGLCVTSLELDGVPVELRTLAAEDGWHAPERGLRWTTGDTVIQCRGAAMLDLAIDLSGRYWPEADLPARRTA